MAKQRGLGKGLASLIPAAVEPETFLEAPVEARTVETTVSCADLKPNPFQPRKTINMEELESLASSIREHGVIQPILIRKAETGYQIIAGERRWRAAQAVGLTEVPVRVLQIDDEGAMELALVENLQREDLNAIEIAEGIQDLISKLSLTHEEAAQKIGLSRTAVTNKLRLLQLPLVVIAMLENDEITEGHARALLSLPTEEKIVNYATLTVQRGLNVRQLEGLVRNTAAAARIDAALPPKRVEENGDFSEEIERFRKNYRLTVKIGGNRKGLGVLIKGLKKWQVQLLLEYIESHSEELFPRE